jgi:hypothetical protein
MLRGLFTRRYFVSCLGGTAVAWPIAARAEQATMPVIVFLHPGTSEIGGRDVAAFRKGLEVRVACDLRRMSRISRPSRVRKIRSCRR